jgi:hypothetical protein
MVRETANKAQKVVGNVRERREDATSAVGKSS